MNEIKRKELIDRYISRAKQNRSVIIAKLRDRSDQARVTDVIKESLHQLGEEFDNEFIDLIGSEFHNELMLKIAEEIELEINSNVMDEFDISLLNCPTEDFDYQEDIDALVCPICRFY